MMNVWKNMTTKKKVLLVIGAVVIVLALAGCGIAVAVAMKPDTTPPETTVATEPAETTTPTTIPVETTETTVATTAPETEPAETTAPTTVPEETVPATEPMVTELVETTPATTPKETEPTETTPKETTPKPTEPKETEPKETQPKPTDPKPTEPPKTHTHSYKAKIVEPTCEEKGYTKHTCSCGDSYTDTYTDVLGHDMYEEVNDPGVGYEGYTYHYCSRCGYSYKDNYTEALPEITATDVQNAIIKYINQYRAEEGSTQLTYLPGMTQVAVYRSKQLTTNYAHDTADKREALAYYQYGEWIDPADYGDPDGEGYYEAQTKEAIGHSGGLTYWNDADALAKYLVDALHASSGHWRYVGSSEYSYTGVGVTKSGNRWYVCVMVGSVNYG